MSLSEVTECSSTSVSPNTMITVQVHFLASVVNQQATLLFRTSISAFLATVGKKSQLSIDVLPYLDCIHSTRHSSNSSHSSSCSRAHSCSQTWSSFDGPAHERNSQLVIAAFLNDAILPTLPQSQ